MLLCYWLVNYECNGVLLSTHNYNNNMDTVWEHDFFRNFLYKLL